MEPALDVLNRALRGDVCACSFLERTSSIYVLDMTDVSKPKTYGCWNFIHQAMNEVERYEAAKFMQKSNNNNNNATALLNGAGLVHHVRLLAAMAVKVARRSPSTDRALVATCIANAASQYRGTECQCRWLVDLNSELRDIVMGRIAAMSFDFSFHRQQVGQQGQSAFADRVVMDGFCAVLSANAVSSGPDAIRHFATEWVIPSSRNLPFFAVASVVLHLALEGMRTTAPAGTKDTLQQLSEPVMSVVLVPTLADAVSENATADDNIGADAGLTHSESSHITAACIRAMKGWCDATDMSLPQIRHVCNKVNLNAVEVISDAMYSDCYEVVDALAELIETTMPPKADGEDDHGVDERLAGRMNQVRHIIHVDESAFQAKFTSDQLRAIESKEMESIVDELVSAIGLQRFRFKQRQINGDHDVCRNLARIAASVCVASLDFSTDRLLERDGVQISKSDHGVVSLLVMGASHPSVNICGIALQVLPRIIPKMVVLGPELLPILQRRAIFTPHRHCADDASSLVAASDACGVVDYQEFQSFRDNVLKESLLVCWRQTGDHYMDSCTSAVEEFCSSSSDCQSSTKDVSLQLEAALFCIEAVASEALDSSSHLAFPHSEQLTRCTRALSLKPQSLMANPLTLARMCSYLRKYSRWYCEAGAAGAAAEMILSIFSLSAYSQAGERPSTVETELRESEVSPLSEAALALRDYLCLSPKHFINERSLSSLRAAWEASYAAWDTIKIEDRVAICVGLCHVLAALPEAQQRIRSFDELATPSLDCLDRMVRTLNNGCCGSTPQEDPVLSRVADEIRMLATMSRTFADVEHAAETDGMESGCDTSPDRRAPIPESILAVVRKGWPAIDRVARSYCSDKNISSAMAAFLCELVPPSLSEEGSLILLRGLSSVATSVLNTLNGVSVRRYDGVFAFLEEVIYRHGEAVDKEAAATLAGSTAARACDREVRRILEALLLETVKTVRARLGEEWNRPKERQGNGQPAFESRSQQHLPLATSTLESVTSESLAAVLSVLSRCMETCPVFLFSLPAGSGMDGDDDDMLLRRAIDAAVGSLNDNDPDVTANGIKFLVATAKQATSQNSSLRAFIGEALVGIRAESMKRLFLSCCGRGGFAVLGRVAELFSVLILSASSSSSLSSSSSSSSSPAELEANLVAAVSQDCFVLGELSRNAALGVFARCARNELTVSDLTRFLQDIWRLHQVEDAEALPSSDAVASFVRKYSS